MELNESRLINALEKIGAELKRANNLKEPVPVALEQKVNKLIQYAKAEANIEPFFDKSSCYYLLDNLQELAYVIDRRDLHYLKDVIAKYDYQAAQQLDVLCPKRQ